MKVFLKMLRKAILVFILFGACLWWGRQYAEVFTKQELIQPDFILDAGHGGEDGGAISITEKKESDLNLEITTRTDQLMGLLGKQSILMREKDISLHDPSAVTLREKKRADLKRRVEIAGEYPETPLISIHQNSYQDSKYWGAQVFYGTNKNAIDLAKNIQAAIKTTLQPANKRQAKPVPESVYLMNHISNKAILVECGFLTNPEEENLLKQEQYQKKFALVLGATLIEE